MNGVHIVICLFIGYGIGVLSMFLLFMARGD